jgi:hypothetical protein
MLVPVEGWFSGPLLPYARERLLDGLRPLGLFRQDYLERLVSGKLGGLRPRRGVKIWLLLTLEAWLRQVLRAATHPGPGSAARMEDMSGALREPKGHDAEVMRRAIKLAERDRQGAEAAADKQALAEAAEEIGVPARYVEEASSELARERAALLAKRRRFLKLGVAAVAVGAGLLVTTNLLRPPPPPPPVEYALAQSPPRWTLNKNPGTQAALRFEKQPSAGEAAVVSVEHFLPAGPEGKYFVNLDASEALPPVENYRVAVFKSRGQGLSQLRLFLEVGEKERWRSPPIQLSPEWTEHRLPLASFEHQERVGEGAWHRGASGRPAGVTRLSFKLGHFMNEASTSGEAAVTGLRFE